MIVLNLRINLVIVMKFLTDIIDLKAGISKVCFNRFQDQPSEQLVFMPTIFWWPNREKLLLEIMPLVGFLLFLDLMKHSTLGQL